MIWGTTRPILGKAYLLISAADQKLEDLSFPTSTLKALKLDLNAFYNDHVLDFSGGTKEGLFKISIILETQHLRPLVERMKLPT